MHLRHASSRERSNYLTACLDISCLSALLFAALIFAMTYILSDALFFSSLKQTSSQHPVIDYQLEDIPLHAATTATSPLPSLITSSSSSSVSSQDASTLTMDIKPTKGRRSTSIVATPENDMEDDKQQDNTASNTAQYNTASNKAQFSLQDVQRVQNDIRSFVDEWKGQSSSRISRSIQRKFIIISDETLDDVRKK